jgi:S1-C subfamily serine protease
MKWYSPNTQRTAVVGLTPFDGGGLTEKTQLDPFGAMGGDSAVGNFEPSDNSRTHHMNDYFSESGKDDLIERLLREKKNNKKKKVKRKRIILKSDNDSWYRQSQFGEKGPVLPTFDPGDWVSRTYKKLMNSEQSGERKRENIPNPSSIVVEVHGIKSGQGFCINDNIILTVNSIVGEKPSVKMGGSSFQAFVLTSNPDLDLAVLAVASPDFKADVPAKLGDSSISKGSKQVSNQPGSPVLTNDNAVVGMVTTQNSVLPINTIKDWLRKNGVDFLES